MSKRFEDETTAIDLGTTNTVISVYDNISQKGEPCVSRDGSNLIPSVIFFESKDKYIVGKCAKEEALISPDRTCVNVKRKMGKTDNAITIDGKVISPEKVSSYILKEAMKSAQNLLEGDIKEAVITVPAYFPDAARKATIEAGRLAGLKVKDIINEPLAAACNYICKNNFEGKSSNIIVVDVGGGTTDLWCGKVSDHVIEEIAITGDRNLGGYDFDIALRDYIIERHIKDKKLDAMDEQELAEKVETAKIALSGKNKTFITVSTQEGRIPVELTRFEFEQCTKKLMDRLEGILKSFLSELEGYGVKTFDKVLLVGGMTRIPKIQELIGKYFTKESIIAENQDEGVSRGAAVYAKMLVDAQENKSERYVIKNSIRAVNRITSRSYGISAIYMGEKQICNMILKNDRLPVTKKRTFYTGVENDEYVLFNVYENDKRDEFVKIDQEYFLSKCKLQIPPLPVKSPIEVVLTLNENGTLTVEGIEPKSGINIKASMESKALQT